jgi:hypothetical protein
MNSTFTFYNNKSVENLSPLELTPTNHKEVGLTKNPRDECVKSIIANQVEYFNIFSEHSSS